MSLSDSSAIKARFRRYAKVLVAIAFLIGLMSLIGWQFDIRFLKRPIPGLAAMNPTTAMCFILCTSSFILITSNPVYDKARRVGYVLAWLLLAISIAILVDVVLPSHFDIDLIFMAEKLQAEENLTSLSRMAPNTAANFLFASIILLLPYNRKATTIAQVLSLLIGLIAMFSILGYAYHVGEFYGLLKYIPMALHTAVCFFLFALSVLLYTVDKQLMKEIAKPHTGGVIGRLFIPFALIIPFMLGMIFMFLYGLYNFSVEFGIASLTLSIIIVFVMLIWYMVYSLNEKDKLHKAAEEEVKVAYSVLQSSIESFKEIMIFSIDKEYRYLNFNSAFAWATHAAYNTKVEKGMSMLKSISVPEDQQKAKANCDRALSGESHTIIQEYGEVKKAYYETRYNPMLDNSGSVIGVTVLSADVTARKAAEEEILELNKELESFSYSVSHDLRAPLRSISGYASILMEDYQEKLDDEGKRVINVISSNTAKMSQLIDDLLNFSRLGRKPVSKAIFNPEPGLRSIIDTQLDTIDKDRLEIRIGDLRDLYGDSALLHHVFLNLFSNAIKYSMKKKNPVVEIYSIQNELEVIYTVKDNGAGFDMQYANKLFAVFQRLHTAKEFKGTGVGLAIASKIIAKHGGKIWAKGEVDKGAEFNFSLPLPLQKVAVV